VKKGRLECSWLSSGTRSDLQSFMLRWVGPTYMWELPANSQKMGTPTCWLSDTEHEQLRSRQFCGCRNGANVRRPQAVWPVQLHRGRRESFESHSTKRSRSLLRILRYVSKGQHGLMDCQPVFLSGRTGCDWKSAVLFCGRIRPVTLQEYGNSEEGGKLWGPVSEDSGTQELQLRLTHQSSTVTGTGATK
jgi:hypothetical protein